MKALLCVLLLVGVAFAQVQVGSRFPQGIVLGDEGSCRVGESDDIGTVRFRNGQLEVCQDNGSWVASANSNLTLNNVEDLLYQLLRQQENMTQTLDRVLEDRNTLDSPQSLANAVHCLGRGVFQSGLTEETDLCECYDDNARGHYVGHRCGLCRAGWSRNAFGDCVVDIEDPELTLHGDVYEYHGLGEPYVDSGYEAVDNHDGNITANVVVSGAVDVNAIGEYVLTYDVTDAAGNSDSKVRTISIVAVNSLRSGPAQVAVFTTPDPCSDSECTERSIVFQKRMTQSSLRIHQTDNLRCAVSAQSGECTWEWKINGQSCATPAPLLVKWHEHGYSGAFSGGSVVSQNHHFGVSFLGYCEELQSGQPLSPGSYSFSLHELDTSGSGTPHLGFPNGGGKVEQHLVEVVEVPYTSNVDIHSNTQTELEGPEENTMITSRSAQFTQPETGGMLKFVVMDSWDCRQRISTTNPVGTCRFEWHIDGETCVSPAPLTNDWYANPYRNIVYPSSLVMYCNETTSGPITAGVHTLTPFFSGIPGYPTSSFLLSWGLPAPIVEVTSMADSQRSTYPPSVHTFSDGSARNDLQTSINTELSTVNPSFYKSEYGTDLRFTWTDSFQCLLPSGDTGNACQWIVLIDGMTCTDPAPLSMTRYAGSGSNGDNIVSMSSMIGYCRTLENGLRITPGWHNVTVKIGTVGSYGYDQTYTGWQAVPGWMEFEEIPNHLYAGGDVSPPDMLLNGDEETFIYVGDAYIEEGVAAWDDFDGDVTHNVNITGSVDTSRPGVYELQYSVSDSQGHVASVSRTVTVMHNNMLHSFPAQISYFTLPDSCSLGACSRRTANVVKHLDDSTLRISWYDNLRCAVGATAAACSWEWKINGASCSSPGVLMASWHEDGRVSTSTSSRVSQNHHFGVTLVGHCSEAGGVPLSAGTYTLTLHENVIGGSHGSPHLGFPNSDSSAEEQHVLEVLEVPSNSNVSVSSLSGYEASSSEDSTILASQSTTFEQFETGAMLRFTVTDSFDCRQRDSGSIGTCRFKWLIDGEECVSPAPMTNDWYTNPYRNQVYSTAMVMYCNATASGPIAAGTHTFAPLYTGVPGGPIANFLLMWGGILGNVEVVTVPASSWSALSQHVMSTGALRNDVHTTVGEYLDTVNVAFYKENYGTHIRLSWTDSFQCLLPSSQTGTACRWIVRIDGHLCADPAPLAVSRYAGSGSSGDNIVSMASMFGYCRKLDNGLRVTPGWHNVTVEVGTVGSYGFHQAYAGYREVNGWMDIEEVPVDVYDAAVTLTNAPDMLLLGENPFVLTVGSSFVDPGVEAWDAEDGDLVSAVVVSGSVDTNSAGSYTVTYSVSDSHGNTSSVNRTVDVVSS